VKSLAMVPIRTRAPIGAIGNYWASRHRATKREMMLLQALADSTSIAMENVEVAARLAVISAEREALLSRQQQHEALSALAVHDLKSPATAISLAALLRLRAEDLPPAERRSWTSVLSSADHIHRMALDLLDIAKCREGRLVPKPVPIDLGALFAEVRELFRHQAEKREQALEIHADVAPGALRADPDLLRRTLQNLVDNALRHSPRQSTLRLEARAGAGGVEIAVCDEGPGVPREMRDRIFERYVQIGEAGACAGGRGLGLTFCRLAVEAHGGSLWIEDNAPRGSRFCFRIPARKDAGG
jgi:signal transduction histidine kinase